MGIPAMQSQKASIDNYIIHNVWCVSVGLEEDEHEGSGGQGTMEVIKVQGTDKEHLLAAECCGGTLKAYKLASKCCSYFVQLMYAFYMTLRLATSSCSCLLTEASVCKNPSCCWWWRYSVSIQSWYDSFALITWSSRGMLNTWHYGWIQAHAHACWIIIVSVPSTTWLCWWSWSLTHEHTSYTENGPKKTLNEWMSEWMNEWMFTIMNEFYLYLLRPFLTDMFLSLSGGHCLLWIQHDMQLKQKVSTI